MSFAPLVRSCLRVASTQRGVASSFVRRVPSSESSFALRSVGISSRDFSSGGARDFSNESDSKKGEEVAGEAAAEGEVSSEEPVSETAGAESTVSKEEKFQAEMADMKDQLMRTLAEMENVRKIARRDAVNSKKFAVQGFAKSLLDVADNMERAIESAKKTAETNPEVATVLEGVEMTDAQLHKAFTAQGVVKFGAVGDAFDPHRHDALFEVPCEDMETGLIHTIVKPGYMLHDRVMRPAQVGTSRKP